MSLDGAIRDGRHTMQVRVYYEDTDFPCLAISQQQTRRHFLGPVEGMRRKFLPCRIGMGVT